MWDQVLKIMDRIIKGKLKHTTRNSKRKYTLSQDMNSFCISPYFINIVPVYALMTKKLYMQKYSKSLSTYLNKVCIWSLMSYINTVESDLSDEDQQIMNKFKATKYNNVTFSKDKSSRKSSFNRRKSSNGIFNLIKNSIFRREIKAKEFNEITVIVVAKFQWLIMKDLTYPVMTLLFYQIS